MSIGWSWSGGLGEDYWPRPGRIFAAVRFHRFSQLADAIDTAFARWDRAHLFVLADGRWIGRPEFDDFDQGFIDGAATRLSTPSLGDQPPQKRCPALPGQAPGNDEVLIK
ncbi:hypothetical protein [Mycobacterium sp.]|uniref:hypothetical protein n=1 Tax=Mycobacterium sp. TaxID=1785 RepID=UPI003C78A162